jgi:hypothetical protein
MKPAQGGRVRASPCGRRRCDPGVVAAARICAGCAGDRTSRTGGAGGPLTGTQFTTLWTSVPLSTYPFVPMRKYFGLRIVFRLLSWRLFYMRSVPVFYTSSVIIGDSGTPIPLAD